MSTIWFDVTTILSWQRPAVGVVRVEAECAAFALRENNEQIKFKFCHYDSSFGYKEVDQHIVRDALHKIQGKKIPNREIEHQVVSAVQTSVVVSLDQKLKAIILNLINKLPAKQRLKAFDFANRRAESFSVIFRSSQELGHSIKLFLFPPKSNFSISSLPNQYPKLVAEKNVPPFDSTDVYLSLGLDWSQKNLMYIFEQKRKIGFKVLFFCYDLIPVKFPHLCVGDVAALFARYFADAAWCADEILCISKCSKSDLYQLLTNLGTPIPSLSVIKLGCELPICNEEDTIAPDVVEILDQRYILYVSTIERRKNHETLYRAYALLVEQGITSLPLLVFVGMPGWGVNDFMADLQFDYRVKPHIKVLNHVADSDLVRLYKNAFFTVYPSLYEGWGLPVAESLAAGKFCLASCSASIPEVGGDLIEYLPPLDVSTWSDRLNYFFSHPDQVLKREDLILKNYRPTSWQQASGLVYAHAITLSTRAERGFGFEERLQHLYYNLLKEGDCCIDIGAHTGRHTIPMACKVGITGSVEAFEPNPEIASKLRNRIDYFKLDWVNTHEYALANEFGETTFNVAVDLPEESGIKKREVYNGPTDINQIVVKLRRLSDFNFKTPRFIKIDTEGAEYSVLLGAEVYLRDAHPVIAFEFGAASYASYNVNPHDLFAYLTEIGYLILSIYGHKLDSDEFAEASLKQDYWDYIACPQEEFKNVCSILRNYNGFA